MDKCSAAAQQYGNCTPHHTLPFTGIDLLTILLAGLAIIVVGVIARRAAQHGTGR